MSYSTPCNEKKPREIKNSPKKGFPLLLLKPLETKRIPNIVEDPNVISSIIVDNSIIVQK